MQCARHNVMQQTRKDYGNYRLIIKSREEALYNEMQISGMNIVTNLKIRWMIHK